MNKKTSLLLCAIGAISLSWGSLNFEYEGIDSTTFAVAIAISMGLGIYLIVCGMYGLFNNKIKKGEKPMAKKKANLMKDEQDAVLSVDLMKREKELETRRKELESLLAEVSKEEKAVEKQLIEKGWVNKNGSWGIE
tara:strand:- start:340 stop:747 length:408 start_codon:yes stop_codon:yes gene_type:complete